MQARLEGETNWAKWWLIAPAGKSTSFSLGRDPGLANLIREAYDGIGVGDVKRWSQCGV